ncbi:hypothetical protein AK812_SmicGene10508 [Symbiodinium microadriaticum]|uniref:Uncharacterized protein n=1 Tax=Symbiodinium microadriaticum TaxID=2951 RepID=A0A1Q9EFM7_SYMMI|nr:hypothetical protein AK812_SmicGene10508 [Symbiodinium microadriaticum]
MKAFLPKLSDVWDKHCVVVRYAREEKLECMLFITNDHPAAIWVKSFLAGTARSNIEKRLRTSSEYSVTSKDDISKKS